MFALDFVSNEIKGYVCIFYGKRTTGHTKKKKSLFTVLTEEASIPDNDNDDDIWDK
jgi:hypothetical protein